MSSWGLGRDHNALIGRSSSTPNFLYATEFSGHGFLQAPRPERSSATCTSTGPPFVDVTPLAAERFTNGAQARPEAHIV
jgi:sarcosine oxidase, subunit beta